MVKRYGLNEIWYVTLSNGQVETFFQNNNYSIDDQNGQRIYFSNENIFDLETLTNYFALDRQEEGFKILRLTDFINAFFEAKDLFFSKSPLLRKRYMAVLKARAKALKDEYLDNSSYLAQKSSYLQGYINKLKSEQQVSKKEALYIGQKIQKIQNQRQENCKGIYMI